MEVKYNNTAGRLLSIFEAAANQAPNVRTDNVWLTVLEDKESKGSKRPQSSELAHVYQLLVPLQVGLVEVETDIKDARPDDSELFLLDFDKLMLAVAPNNIRGQWEQGKRLLSERALHCLELCANELPREGELTEDELQELADAVNNLFNDVKNSSIRNPLKRWILSLLSAVKKSIDNYHVFGPRGLRESFSFIAGEIILHAESLNEVKTADVTVWTRIGKVFNNLHAIALKTKELLPLITAGGKLIEIPFLGEDGSAPAPPE